MDLKFVDACNIPYVSKNWLTFDDVVLMPRFSTIPSRNDPSISLQSKVGALPLGVPIISANMDTITGANMANLMHELGGLGILHRFYPDKTKYMEDIKKTGIKTGIPAFSIGLDPKDIDFVGEVLKDFKHCIVCVDVAHGHQEQVFHYIRKLALNYTGRIQIIGGNVGTPAGVQMLVQAGVHAVKIGIGCGSLCTTRMVTGHGVPQLSAILNARRALFGMQSNVSLIADGGIRTSGDIVKALAAGADAVMVGNLLAGTTETPGPLLTKSVHTSEYLEVKESELKCFKKYRGQASRAFMENIGKIGVASEGESIMVPYVGSAKPILEELIAGIKSGMTYSGAKNLDELFKLGTFTEITHNGYIEGTPHGLKKGD